MAKRIEDWFRQVEKDLQHAGHALEDDDYEWSCFASQQAVEKAIKAVYEKMGIGVRGHSILGLIKGLESSFKIPEKFYSYARTLSRYYLEARYPSGFPEGAPMDYFDEDMARGGLNAAEKILEWCRNIIRG